MQTIFVLSGSHREKSQSGRMAAHIAEMLGDLGANSDLYDLAGSPLPFWREDFWDNPRQGWDEWEGVAARLKQASGLVIVTPEWHGMAPSGLKNFFLLASARELADKPGLIVSVSSGMGGAYPVAELRMSAAKNNRLCFMPDHVIIRDVENIFADNAEQAEVDQYLDARLRHDLALLLEYSSALDSVRAKELRDLDAFPNGM